MKIFIPAALLYDKEVMLLINVAVTRGAKLTPLLVGTWVNFSSDGAAVVDSEEWDFIFFLIPKGLRIEDSIFWSPVVPYTTLDNKVPADWPEALKQDPEFPDDPAKTVTKTWEEWTRVRNYGSDQCCICLSGPKTLPDHLFGPMSHEQLMERIAKFGGYMGQADFNTWVATNKPESTDS